jgi:hypothetical protein
VTLGTPNLFRYSFWLMSGQDSSASVIAWRLSASFNRCPLALFAPSANHSASTFVAGPHVSLDVQTRDPLADQSPMEAIGYVVPAAIVKEHHG